jgi:hypothetical protein
VRLPGTGAGVRNLRYRGIYDPDSDNDQIADVWEQQIVDYVTTYTEVAQVLPGGDADNDGLLNLAEYNHGTNPTNPDTDGDGMPDGWEVEHGLNPKSAADGSEALGPNGKPIADRDGDGLSNIEEYRFGSRPDRVSTIQDGFSDKWKHRWELDPLVALVAGDDPDDDGLTNAEEHTHGTNPNVKDSDGDGWEDGWEVVNGFDPLRDDSVIDSDNDGLLNAAELIHGTDPLNPDTDDDGLEDGDEVHTYLTDPLDIDTDEDGLPDGWEVGGLIMHFSSQPIQDEHIDFGRTPGAWELVNETTETSEESQTVIRQNWMRLVSVFDSTYNQSFSLTEYMDRYITVMPNGVVVQPSDGWINDRIANTLVRASSIPQWTVSYDSALRLWMGVRQGDGYTSTWWWVHTNPRSGDTDGDGLPDRWEFENWLNPDKAVDAGENPDDDLLVNSQEYVRKTHPFRADTDGDQLSDGHEVSVTLSDPLDPRDPGAIGGGTPPVIPVRPVATRTDVHTVESAPRPGGGGTTRAPTLSGRGGGSTPVRPSRPFPLSGPIQTNPGSNPPAKPKAPPAEEIFLETREINKSVTGGEGEPGGGDGDGASDPNADGDDDMDGILNRDDDDYIRPYRGGGEEGDEKYRGVVTYYVGDSKRSDESSSDYNHISGAHGYLNGAQMNPDTDWEKEQAALASERSVTATASAGYAAAREVRLVRKTDPASPESYEPVEVEVKRTYLKIKRYRTIPDDGSAPGDWVTEPVEKVELVIPVNKSKSTEDGEAAKVLLEPQMSEGIEREVRLVPVELITDIDNDGKIGGADRGLAQEAIESGATEEEIDEGTEFLFANDNLSNGAWDTEDTTTEGKPADADDDDAEELRINPGITEGEVWLDHPAIAGLKFYRDKKCTQPINLSPSQRLTISASTPDKVFVRAESVNFPDPRNPQVEGELKLMIKPPGGAAAGIEAAKMKLTIVKTLGAEKYFYAATDYIYENNSKFCARDWKKGGHEYRVISMLESKTTMDVYDAYPAKEKGIDEVIASQSSQTVIINGNQCFDLENIFTHPPGFTTKCHGRIVSGGTLLQPPSDDRTADPGSPLAGSEGSYISQSSGTFSLKGGIVPVAAGLGSAMGGMSTNYGARVNSRSQIVGRVEDVSDENLVFTASQLVGEGGVPDLKAAAVDSGVADTLTGEDRSLGGRGAELLCLDGSTSVAVAYENGSGTLQVGPNPGRKHSVGYFVNTYLMFKCDKPR